jgi:hypothetical protein
MEGPMIPTTAVTLTLKEEHYNYLDQQARERGVTFDHIFREIVDEMMARSPEEIDAFIEDAKERNRAESAEC